MRLDIHDDAVILGPGEDLPVVVAGDPEDLFAGEALDLERAIDRIDHRAVNLRREPNRLLNVRNAMA